MFWSASASSFCRHEIKIMLRLLTRTRLPLPLISHSFSLHYHWFTFPSLLIKRSTSIRWTAKKIVSRDSTHSFNYKKSQHKSRSLSEGIKSPQDQVKAILSYALSPHTYRGLKWTDVTLPSLKQKLRHSQNSDRSTNKMLNLNWRGYGHGFWFYSRSWFRCGLHGVYDFTIFSNLRRRWWTRLSLIVDLGSLRVF